MAGQAAYVANLRRIDETSLSGAADDHPVSAEISSAIQSLLGGLAWCVLTMRHITICVAALQRAASAPAAASSGGVISWTDLQKQVSSSLQSRGISSSTIAMMPVSQQAGVSSGFGGSSLSSFAAASSLLPHQQLLQPFNKAFVKQCTDYLIRHIKSKRVEFS